MGLALQTALASPCIAMLRTDIFADGSVKYSIGSYSYFKYILVVNDDDVL